jgi:type IV pilus assembly protein PilN
MNHVSKRVRTVIGGVAYAAIARDLRGYNLMPHRGRRVRAARRTRAFGAACAALGGIGVAAAIAAIEGRDETQLASRRHTLEARIAGEAAQLAEHARLSAVLARRERETARVRQWAASRDDFLALLDRLSGAVEAGVVLTELHRRDGETVLSGRVGDQRRLSAWLDDLRGARGVASAQVVSLRRPQPEPGGIADATDRGLEFVARLVYPQSSDQAGDGAAAQPVLRAAVPSTTARGHS